MSLSGCNDHQVLSARLASAMVFSVSGQTAPASIHAFSKAISRGVNRAPVGGIISVLSVLVMRRINSLSLLLPGVITLSAEAFRSKRSPAFCFVAP